MGWKFEFTQGCATITAEIRTDTWSIYEECIWENFRHAAHNIASDVHPLSEKARLNFKMERLEFTDSKED